MAAWHYIKGRWWIFAIPTVSFLIIGTALVILDTVADPSPGWSRPWYDSMLFLGIFFIISPLVAILWILGWTRRGRHIERELLERSIPGRAIIVSIMETGLYTNNVPEVEMVLEVVTDMHPAYRVVHREHVNLIALSKFLPGVEIEVRVDSKDKGNILLSHPNT
ncbi:MAG: hypothetical protein K8S24_06560 [Candidatus Aegiribacteria sp.]|nr:hypothetical protein [Candidatus Aegiribacteria sp.]